MDSNAKADKLAALERIRQTNDEAAFERSNPAPEPAGLSIVIPAYNALGTVEPLLEQLAALPEVATGDYEVILTDDASTDGTVATLRQRYPQFSYVESAQNTGFGPNCNRGIAAATKAYCALVNTDIELAGNPFSALLGELHADQDRFVLMPLVYNTARQQVENLQELRFKRGLVWNADLPEQNSYTVAIRAALASGQVGTGLLPPGPKATVETILCGACFVCATARLRALEGFDPHFTPFYWEDVDLGMRATRQGAGPPAVLTTALVFHRHSESIDKHAGPTKFRHLRLNQLRFVLRHYHPWLIYRMPWRLRSAVPILIERGWLLLRGLREQLSGDRVLAAAYFRAALGSNKV